MQREFEIPDICHGAECGPIDGCEWQGIVDAQFCSEGIGAQHVGHSRTETSWQGACRFFAEWCIACLQGRSGGEPYSVRTHYAGDITVYVAIGGGTDEVI